VWQYGSLAFSAATLTGCAVLDPQVQSKIAYRKA